MRRIATVLLALAAAASIAATANAQSPAKMTIATGVDPAFSQFYVAKEAGLFEKNGLDVSINTGPSGSAMVPFLINNQIHAAYGSDLAGVRWVWCHRRNSPQKLRNGGEPSRSTTLTRSPPSIFTASGRWASAMSKVMASGDFSKSTAI